MVRDDQHRPLHAAKILASEDARPSEQQHCWPHQAIKRQRANPSHRPPSWPARIAKYRPASTGIVDRLSLSCRLHQLFEIGDRLSIRKIRLAQIHLITVFERAD